VRATSPRDAERSSVDATNPELYELAWQGDAFTVAELETSPSYDLQEDPFEFAEVDITVQVETIDDAELLLHFTDAGEDSTVRCTAVEYEVSCELTL